MVFLLLLLFGLIFGGLVACSDTGYYLQAIQGHSEILLKRRPIAKVIDDPATTEQLRQRLQLVLDMRDFASRELHLPENGSYRSYADLGRSEVVWNVVATPEFSLEPLTWSFPFAGNVSYRGYYDKNDAEDFVKELQQGGNDTELYGVTAYSTLGWFDDPVLNTFIDRPEASLAGMIFHELAHQRLYVKDDSTFSEAFAEVVEQEGVLRWLRHRGEENHQKKNEEQTLRQREFIDFLLEIRRELEAVYASDRSIAAKRSDKARILAGVPERYRNLKQEKWQGFDGFDRWFARPLNNARLASIATYNDRKPALLRLLQACKGDLESFYREAEELAKLPKVERRARLSTLEGTVGQG